MYVLSHYSTQSKCANILTLTVTVVVLLTAQVGIVERTFEKNIEFLNFVYLHTKKYKCTPQPKILNIRGNYAQNSSVTNQKH